MDTDGALHHGVLAHEDDGVTTETLPDVLELVGSDIVCGDDQHLRVVVQELAKLRVVRDLLVGLR